MKIKISYFAALLLYASGITAMERSEQALKHEMAQLKNSLDALATTMKSQKISVGIAPLKPHPQQRGEESRELAEKRESFKRQVPIICPARPKKESLLSHSEIVTRNILLGLIPNSITTEEQLISTLIAITKFGLLNKQNYALMKDPDTLELIKKALIKSVGSAKAVVKSTSLSMWLNKTKIDNTIGETNLIKKEKTKYNVVLDEIKKINK